MNILLLASHAVAEYDDLRMLSDLGYSVFAPGGYANPRKPLTDMRPPLDLPYRADLDELCCKQRERHLGDGEGWAIDWAKADIHPDLLDWADTIIVHHFPERWIAGQWQRIKHKRVIWRTCGQSNVELERFMQTYVRQGLQIVRYSPKEKSAFTAMGAFAGEDAMIRFGKYPADWYGWTGEDAVIGNVTQDMIGRADHCGLSFYVQATHGLPARPAGKGSERLPGGVGELSYDAMREYLRKIRVYLYTGTQPASYTLGLIEAMMTGVPVVSIGPQWHWVPALFEGHEIATMVATEGHLATWLRSCLEDADYAREESGRVWQRAVDLFGIEYIAAQWKGFLGDEPVSRVPAPLAAHA